MDVSVIEIFSGPVLELLNIYHLEDLLQNDVSIPFVFSIPVFTIVLVPSLCRLPGKRETDSQQPSRLQTYTLHLYTVSMLYFPVTDSG